MNPSWDCIPWRYKIGRYDACRSFKGTQIIVATQSTDLLCHFEPEEVITVNQVEGATQMVRLNSEDLNHWLGDYTLGDLWKQNIVKGGQPE